MVVDAVFWANARCLYIPASCPTTWHSPLYSSPLPSPMMETHARSNLPSCTCLAPRLRLPGVKERSASLSNQGTVSLRAISKRAWSLLAVFFRWMGNWHLCQALPPYKKVIESKLAVFSDHPKLYGPYLDGIWVKSLKKVRWMYVRKCLGDCPFDKKGKSTWILGKKNAHKKLNRK